MPEENEVSTLGLCDFNTTHETKPHEFHNWCSNWKPLSAADAGPRQLMGVCPFEDRPHPVERCSVPGIWEPVTTEPAPVPQEAAHLSCQFPLADSTVCLQVKGHSGPHDAATAPDWAMRRDEPLKALRQWEADTEAPANASEGNAFIDGFQAGREAGSERERELREALSAAIPFLFEHGRHQDQNCYRNSTDGCYCGLNKAQKLIQKAEASRLLGGESK